MKFREGQEVMMVGEATNPHYDGPRKGDRCVITQAPFQPKTFFDFLEVESRQQPCYQVDGMWGVEESDLRPIPDEKPADEDFQEDLRQWLKPKEVVHG